MLSPDALLTAGNVVRQSIVPPDEALKIPASVTAPVPVPAGNVAVYVIVFVDTTVEERATRPPSVPKVVSPAAAEVAEAAVAKDAALAAIDAELKIAIAARAELFPQIDKALADLYEKVGAAKLHNGQCTGCNLAINAGDMAKLNALAADEVARCEECRRILVRL